MLAVGGCKEKPEQRRGPPYSTSPSQDRALVSGSFIIGKGSSLILVLQLLQKIKQVNFTLYKSHISFDANGDIRKGYNIIMWNWSGPSWSFNVVGTFSVNPDSLSIDQGKILWHTKDRQVPFCIHILFIAYC